MPVRTMQYGTNNDAGLVPTAPTSTVLSTLADGTPERRRHRREDFLDEGKRGIVNFLVGIEREHNAA
jgi:hypothetical protein